jgi:phospholipid N-methyltransferase
MIELEMIKNIIVMENEAGVCIRFKDTVEYALLKDRLVELESLQNFVKELNKLYEDSMYSGDDLTYNIGRKLESLNKNIK